jgi:hypothetical protein
MERVVVAENIPEGCARKGLIVWERDQGLANVGFEH